VCADRPPRPTGRRWFRRHDGGNSAVEFALISPVFFAALFGIAQFGWAFLCGQSVRNAVQKEARLLISAPNTTADQIKTAILADLKNIISPTISVAVTTETASGATVKRVTCTYSHQVLFPFAPSVTLDLSSSVVVPMAVP
jgi:Flp pilus assembly protein TadG